MNNQLITKKQLPAAGIAIVAFVLLPILFMALKFSYGILICCLIQIYIIAVSGLDIVFGYSGQISIGHAAFYAIGAYCSGMLHNYLGIPALISIVLGAIVSALIGALLAYPASKLVFHFLALATIAFGEIVYQLITHSPGGITGDFRGLFSDSINLFGFKLNTNMRFYYFGLVCVVLFLIIKQSLVKSKVGRAFIAIRENTHAADGMGIDVRKYKVLAFSSSAFFTAFAGGLYMHFALYLSPETFVQKQSILFITMLLFGGTASALGPVVGVVAVMVLTEMLRSFQDYQMLIYGILMLIVIVGIPGGLYGAFRDIKKLPLRKPKRRGAED